MFISRKLNEDLKFQEVKPAIVNQQCAMQDMLVILAATSTNALMDTNGNRLQYYLRGHNSDVPPFLSEQFHVLTKGSKKFDCLIKEMSL